MALGIFVSTSFAFCGLTRFLFSRYFHCSWPGSFITPRTRMGSLLLSSTLCLRLKSSNQRQCNPTSNQVRLWKSSQRVCIRDNLAPPPHRASIVASADFYELSVPTMFPPQQWCDLRYVSHFLWFIITKQRWTNKNFSTQVFGAFWYGFCFNYLLYICYRICLHSPIDGYAKVFGVVLFAGCRRNGPNCIPQLSREQAINSYPHFQQTNTTTVYYLVFSYFKKSDKFCSVGSSLQNKNICSTFW